MTARIEQEQLSVRRTEEAVRAVLSGKNESNPAADNTESSARSTRREPTPHVLSLQDNLRQQLAARVEIRLKKEDAGQIVIHFGSNDDFDRIVGQLRKSA